MTTLNLPADDERNWGSKYRTDMTAVRDVADANALLLLGMGTYTIRWNSGTSSWPSIPGGLPGGTVIRWDSLHDSAATTPPNATIGYQWFRKLP